jgi:pSer/pThr/pTyr-binding forkhead associated (FHA) protein
MGDEKVSKRHATLIRRDGRWCVLDGFVEFNSRGKPSEYKASANGVIIERVNDRGKIISRERLRSLQFRPLIHGDIIRLSPQTSFIYEEISPSLDEPRGDDRDTFTGQKT